MRRWVVASLMVLGLLVQAATVVRHSSMMAAMMASTARTGGQAAALNSTPHAETGQTGAAQLLADLAAAICHPDGAMPGPLGSGGGDADKSNSTCPICNGLASAYGLAGTDLQVQAIQFRSQVVAFTPIDERVARHAFIRPQSRGPPSLA